MTTPNGRSSKVSGPSNRLLSMKFMQRAAASHNTTPKSPFTPSGPPAKRQRTSATSSPATPTDYDAVQAAVAAEEAKRAAAMERQAAEAGETRWVLSFMEPEKESRRKGSLNVVSAGFADLDNTNDDDNDDDEDDVPQVGRMAFGKKPPPPAQNNGSDSDSESDSSEAEEDKDPTTAMIREQRKEAARAKRRGKKEAEAAKMAQFAAGRKKEVNLNKLKSISGGSSNQRSSSKDIDCFGCGRKGHIKSDCPNTVRRGRQGD
ncbi:uncharacterized protein IWZ02DRAFT_493473 [Phyllosticta citriasiana]|uniref:CCHC-type domain-containing protein n=1 Tax=Phyllosticta citriasiana TaxID=595635 RepID=A0ABR1KXL2_9PEZI